MGVLLLVVLGIVIYVGLISLSESLRTQVVRFANTLL